MVATTNVASTINWPNTLAIAVSIFIAVISGLALYILKDWYGDHKRKKIIRKILCSEISFNIAQIIQLKTTINNLKKAIDSSQGKLSFELFSEGGYNATFTYSSAVFGQLVTSGVVFELELIDSESLIKLDSIYKMLQIYPTIGQVINESVQGAIASKNGVLSAQENNLLDYVLFENFITELNSHIVFLKNCQSTINKPSQNNAAINAEHTTS